MPESKTKTEGKDEDSPRRPSKHGHSHDRKEEMTKRIIKWLSFTKPKIVFGFEHLASSQAPSTSSASRGISICFDKIHGWNIPTAIVNEVQKSRGKFELSLQLSLSLFHFGSGSFFGSTWMGTPVEIDDRRGIDRAVMDIDYSEIVYLVSRVVDPSCVGVVELVCNKIDTKKSLIVAQYGCGWAMVNVFMQPFPADVAEGPDNVLSSSVPIYSGSPRDLVLDNDIKSLTSRLKEIAGSKLFFRIFSHRKLTPMVRLVSENQLVGRFEVVPGLVAKPVTLPGTIAASTVSCVGEETFQLGKKGVVTAPSKPIFATPLTLRVDQCYVYIPDRAAMEGRLRSAVLKSLASPASTEIRILSRTLKIGIHNGHTIIGSEWHSYGLEEDEDDNILITVQKSIEISGYVPHEYMSLVVLLEYDIGVPSAGSHTDTATLLNSTSLHSNRPSTRIALGCSMYIPFDGEELLLRNVLKKDPDLLGVELPMTVDNCSLLTQSPIYADEALSRADKGDPESKSDGSGDDDEEFIVSFDLFAHHPKEGEVKDGDAVAVEGLVEGKIQDVGSERDEDTLARGSTRRSGGRPRYAAVDGDADTSVLVGGTTEVPMLQLDPAHYGINRQASEVESGGLIFSPRLRIPRDKNSLLARSLMSRVVAGAMPEDHSEILTDHDDRNRIRIGKVGDRSLFSREGVTLAEPKHRDLTRGARARLSRYGYQDAVTAVGVSSVDVVGQDRRNVQSHVNVDLEAGDPLTANEVLLSFAGFRSVKLGVPPKSIYLTYQFYTCMPTRTEVMRLSPAAPGEVSALIREDAFDRGETALATRHCIDCSLSTPTEAENFAKYLACGTLYVDIWNADSLVYMGSVGIPLRRLMRQGEPGVKASLECDIINGDVDADYSGGGIASTILYEREGMSGVVVGSLAILMTNVGYKGKGLKLRLDQDRNIAQDEVYSRKLKVDGLNWRSHGSANAAEPKESKRPKNVVRARPLAESTPELSDALSSYRGLSDDGGRSLRSVRGNEGLHTLTYDEVVLLFKRFQGPVKGTLQYKGPLLALLDVPTWSAGYRRLTEAYKNLIEDGVNVEKEILRHVNGEGKLSAPDMKEFLRAVFDRAGVKYKPDELMVVVRKFIRDDSESIHPSVLIDFCRDDASRQEWSSVSKRLLRLREKADLVGLDIEQLLSEQDVNGTGFIGTKAFRTALEELSKHYRLSAKDIDVATKHFSDRPTKGSEPRDPVSLSKVMAFFGKDYSGSIIHRLKGVLSSKGDALYEAFKSHRSLSKGYLNNAAVEEVLRGFGVFDILSHDQVKRIIAGADKEQRGRLTAKEFLGYLHVPFEERDTRDAPKSSLTTEELLRVLIDRSKAKGSSIAESFRHFDSDGDGIITPSELEEGLDRLGIFDNIPQWREQVPSIVAKIDKSNDGCISLKEFFRFLGDDSYAPDIIQKMTKVFAVAIEKGMTFELIFKEIDTNASGKISAKELHTGLESLGTFKNVKLSDIEELIGLLDEDKDQNISPSDFVKFFKSRVETALKERSKKNAEKVVIKFRGYMWRVMGKGGKAEDIFKYFDKDASGDASMAEISLGLKKLPNFKDLTTEEADILVKQIDFDESGSISLVEFKKFVGSPPIVHADTKPIVKEQEESKGESKEESKVDKKHDAESVKSLFTRHMNRISQIDGSVARLLAYLDDDEDGLITQTALMKMLHKEDVFDTVSEKDIEKLLVPLLHNGQINVGALLRFLEGKDTKENRLNDHTSEPDEGKEEDVVDSYEYSKDSETRSLEKKLRGFGRVVAKKGVDVERLFGKYDATERGLVRRTDFINVLSELGLYLLEKGKSVDEAVAGDNADPERQAQLRQVRKLKGSYMDQAERLAHKFVLDGADGAKETEFRDHLESMALINWYRQGQKKMLLQRVLSHSLAATIRIYPRFGTASFFEYPITNPFGHEERFLIEVKDQELKLVSNFEEWMVFRRSNTPCVGELGPAPMEAEMFDYDGDGNVIVALLPHETLHIPFVFLSLKPHAPNDASSNARPKRAVQSSWSADAKGESKGSEAKETPVVPDDETPLRHTEVRIISCSHGHVCSVVKIAICPRAFVVNRTLRFFEPENTIMKRRIILSAGNTAEGGFAAAPKFVHCVERTVSGDSRVMIDWGQGGSSSGLEFLLRYRCGAFPDTGNFYLCIYNDPFQCSLYEVWEIVVQTRQNVFLHASIGGSMSIDLVVRGDRFTRRARAFASAAMDKVEFHPDNVFQVIPGALNKVSLRYYPKMAGQRRVQVNLVDVDSRELISAWLVTVTTAAPPVMRQYDVDMAVGEDVHKKILFKNPWNVARRFLMSSSDEELMKPRVEHLEVAAHGNSYLRLWFNGSAKSSSGRGTLQDVYLFLNNDEGQNEECFLFRVKFV